MWDLTGVTSSKKPSRLQIPEGRGHVWEGGNGGAGGSELVL